VVLQSTTLDKAADDHSNYQVINNDQNAGPAEVSTRTGFTGATVSARVAAAGFVGTASETSIGLQVNAVDGVRAALSTPYQRLTLLGHGVPDVGLGFVEPGSTRPAGTPSLVVDSFFGTLVATTGVRSSALPQAMLTTAAGISVYPVDGAVNVPVLMYRETPNPVQAELGDWGNPRFPGYIVSLQVPSDKTLAVTTFTLTRIASTGNTPVLAKLLDANDSTYLRPNAINNWAMLVPLTPLEIGAVYEASLNGTASGVAFTKTWRFTTRTGFTAATPVRLSPGNVVSISYTTPSGILLAAQATPTGCGPSYNPTTVIGLQTVTLREGAVTPLAGCVITILATDLGTLATDTRSFTLN
jgi:hypothetical protein